jgi:hypothetical protein
MTSQKRLAVQWFFWPSLQLPFERLRVSVMDLALKIIVLMDRDFGPKLRPPGTLKRSYHNFFLKSHRIQVDKMFRNIQKGWDT